MSETSDELRAQAEDLRDHFTGGACSCFSDEDAADTIAALLARLATAEADLAVVNEIVGDYFDGAGGHDLMVELRSRLAAVARREQP